jgi:hypothetical protein
MRKTPASMSMSGVPGHPRADDHSADDAALYGANRRSYARIAGHRAADGCPMAAM